MSANNSGTIIFSGPNTDTGTLNIPGPGGTGTGSSKVTLKLGAANTIASFGTVNLAGGILDPDGFTHNMGSTTLVLSASTAGSTIDYEAGPGEIDFANSSAVAWASGTTLNLANWNPGSTLLRFGTDATGLLASQLAEIEFNGSGLGSAQLDSQRLRLLHRPRTVVLPVARCRGCRTGLVPPPPAGEIDVSSNGGRGQRGPRPFSLRIGGWHPAPP